MTIEAGDVKLVKTQVMDDVPEGGGAPTAEVVTDGATNSIFPDVSELDRAGGRVSLRKLCAHIQTADRDTYLGGNIIVAEGPQDPRVAVTIFSTKDMFDRRDAAKNRIEAYLAPGPEWPGYLLENHIAGQRSIQLFQQVNSDVVAVGHTLLLVQDEGLVTQKSQYVRTTRVTAQERTFVAASTGKPYQALVVTADISDPLREDFKGSPPSEFFARQRPAGTMTRDTVVADAASYFGVANLVDAVGIGDVSAQVDSIFTQLVPSAQTEIPLVDFSAAGQKTTLVESANGTVSYTSAQPFNSTTVLSVGNCIKPGSLSIAAGASTLLDDGGQLFDGATVIGTVDYARGEVRFAATAPTYSGTKTVTFRPAGAPLELADSAALPVTQETRAFNYIITVNPPPAPGTAQVSYRANGRWYDLKDNGGGVLKGSDSSFGSGTVSYNTGTIAITAGALPDVGSSVLYNWGSPATYINRSDLPAPTSTVAFQLDHAGVAPNTVVISWNDGAARTATDDGKGNITGDATGSISYQTGAGQLSPNNLPAGGQEYTVNYSWGAPDTRQFADPANVGGEVELDLGATDITPNTVELDVPATYPKTRRVIGFTGGDTVESWGEGAITLTLKDDGLGGVKVNGVTVGSIDYATGILTFNLGLLTVSYNREVYQVVSEGRFIAYISESA